MNATVGSQGIPQSLSKDFKTQMINLLAETLHDIIAANQSTDTVRYVRSRDGEYAISWDEFAKLADTHYDNGYGSQEVPTDLIVEFLDGTYLYRTDYDGAEGWEYTTPLPPIQPNAKPITKVVGKFWPDVQGLHNPNEWDEDDR